jgi:hypothetical protein
VYMMDLISRYWRAASQVSKNMQLEIVEPEIFFRPEISIPCHDMSEGLYEKRKERNKSRIDIRNVRFVGISYYTIDRFGYDEEQCDQIPVINAMMHGQEQSILGSVRSVTIERTSLLGSCIYNM